MPIETRNMEFAGHALNGLVVGGLFYLGWRDVTNPKPTHKSAQAIPIKPGDQLTDPLMAEESQTLQLRVTKYGNERDVDGTDLYIKIADRRSGRFWLSARF